MATKQKDSDLAKKARKWQRLKAEAEAAYDETCESLVDACDQGLIRRDAAAIMGLSVKRVEQILKERRTKR